VGVAVRMAVLMSMIVGVLMPVIVNVGALMSMIVGAFMLVIVNVGTLMITIVRMLVIVRTVGSWVVRMTGRFGAMIVLFHLLPIVPGRRRTPPAGPQGDCYRPRSLHEA
jgi:hypothetical protein